MGACSNRHEFPFFFYIDSEYRMISYNWMIITMKSSKISKTPNRSGVTVVAMSNLSPLMFVS